MKELKCSSTGIKKNELASRMDVVDLYGMIVNGTNSLRNCSGHNTSRVELYYEENSGSNKFKKIIFVRIHVIYKDVKIHIQSSYYDQGSWVIVENCIKEFNKRIK